MLDQRVRIRLTKGGDDYRTDLLAIKQNLAQGAPVVIGMMVGGSFMQDMMGRRLYSPDRSDYSGSSLGGHAMCVIGYDDYFEGGAFQVMNSWGQGWGEDGLFWMRYNDFDYFTREAYGLYPMGDADKVISDILECFTYIFGKETDGTSYVLFPYTKKHSPYCGITGTRVFPKDHSLYPDELGDRDYIAIVVSRQKLDYNLLNDAINNAPGNTYDQKVYAALEDELVRDIDFTGGNTVRFSTGNSSRNAVAMVMEIIK